MNLGGVIHINKTGIFFLFCLTFVLFLYGYSNISKDKPSEEINLRILLEVAIEAAKNGGYEVVKAKDDQNVQSKGLTKEGLQDSVTAADFNSHCSMLNTIKTKYPYVKVISEEAKTECRTNVISDFMQKIGNLPDVFANLEDITMWIDPLDATYEYTEKLYKYVTTMVCIAVHGKPVIGVIHNPFTKETSWAWVHKGVSKDLDIETKHEAKKPRIIISRSHSGQIKNILDQNGISYELIIAAGAGYKALQVAKGNAEAYMHSTIIKKWDICAGNAILNALGGKMTTKYGKEIDYANEVNVQNEDGLVATMKDHDYFLKWLVNS